jgi:hypothetical protein
LSKINDYLADNLDGFMLSRVRGRDQEESGRAADPVPNWESSTHAFGKEREQDGATRITVTTSSRVISAMAIFASEYLAELLHI